MNQLPRNISSLEVAEMVGRNHADVMRDVRNIIGHLGESRIAESYFVESTYLNIQNKELPCFLLTKKGCELYGTRMTGEKGTRFAVRYIERFNQMEQQLTEMSRPSYEITDPVARATKWIEEEQQRQQLIQTVEEQKPMVMFANAIVGSTSSILIREMAVLLKQNGINMGQGRLFDYLRSNGYLVKRKGSDYNMPTQKSMNLGLFEIKETPVMRSTGSTISKTPKVTAKGQKYFINHFLTKGDTA